jgi:hypothetical protein
VERRAIGNLSVYPAFHHQALEIHNSKLTFLLGYVFGS